MGYCAYTKSTNKGNPVLNNTTKTLTEYEGIYWVSSNGYVTNGRIILKTYKINSGYSALKLVNSVGERKSFLLHRLVATAFIPNPDNKSEVNHIDGNKRNCAVANLEWATSSENKIHALATGLKIYNKPTLGINKGKTSQYHNVTFDKNRNKWIGAVRHNKQTLHQKRFDTEIEAAMHVNWVLDHLGITDRPKNVVV